MYKARALGIKVSIILSEYLFLFGLNKVTYEKKTQQSTTSKEIKLKAFIYGNKKRNQVHISIKHGVRSCGCDFTELTFQFEEHVSAFIQLLTNYFTNLSSGSFFQSLE